MRLRVQHPLIQRHQIRLRVEQVEVLERLGRPEALHLIRQGRAVRVLDVVDGRVRVVGLDVGQDGLPHLPAFVLPRGVAGDPVHVPD